MTEKKGISVSLFEKEDGTFDNDAINMGVYAIKLRNKTNGKSILLYIGESVWMVVRCSGHLHRIMNEPEYMGLKQENLDNENFELVFEVIKPVKIKDSLKDEELHEIHESHPLTQGKIRDWQVENKVEIVQDAIKRDLI